MNVVDFYREAGVILSKSGNRWTALCPFPGHKEKEPSFVVYKDGSYHCFGCGAHGTAKTFQKAFKISFRPFPDFDCMEDRYTDFITVTKEKLETKLTLVVLTLPRRSRFKAYDMLDYVFLEARYLSKNIGITKLDLVRFLNSNVSKILEEAKNFS